MKKRLISILIALTTCFSLCFCGTSPQSEEQVNLPDGGADVAEQPEESDEVEPEEYYPPAVRSDLAEGAFSYNDDVTVNYYEIQYREKSMNDGLTFASQLQVGWNLGNTFDAFIADDDVVGAGLSCETSWVGIGTSRDMIDAVKSAGFSTIRIPVSWHNHLDEDLTIKKRWLDRVQEVVDYAISADLYVILNIHHDNDKSYDYYFYPDSEHKDISEKYIASIWGQLAERFKNYDEHLIFESLNEPRLIGTNVEWNLTNAAECRDACETISYLNQVFVDTVRATGGNNADRYLLVPGYAASVDGALRAEFVVPKDSAENRIMIETHAYSPYDFALQSGGKKVFGDAEKAFIDQMFDSLYDRFISQGIPVVMDEFGARNKDNLQDRIDFTSYYIAKAKSVGIPCVWWDNNCFEGDGEQFGLLERNTITWKYPEILEAMVMQYIRNGVDEQ